MLRFYLILLSLTFFTSASMAKDVLDKPISVSSFKDLSAVCDQLKVGLVGSDLDSLNQAVTYLTAYARVDYDQHATEPEKEALLINLTNRKTPREIIVLGHVIWLERTRRALVQEERIAEPDTDRSAQLRRNMGEANQKAALEIIRQYLTQVPNK